MSRAGRSVSYATTLRDIGDYEHVLRRVPSYTVFGIDSALLYHAVSIPITAIYLSLALSEAHRLPVESIWFAYFISFVALMPLIIVVAIFA